jgi:serine/threonine protein kinase
VLVADDDADLRRMLSALVSSWGLTPVAAADGHEALAVLTGPDAPARGIIDWMMPGLTGPEVCRRARAEGVAAHLVLLTARDQKECVVEGLDAGADDYVVKPFDLRELRARVMRGPRNSAPMLAPEVMESGAVVAGRYRLEVKLGEGGMGSVWRAAHVELGHALAIKIIRPDLAASPQLRARFETEARAASLVRSPYLAQIYDYGVTPGGVPFLAMEYLRGQTLTSLVAEYGGLPLSAVSVVVSQIARGLSVAHEAGIVHRDVKPENVFLEDVGEDSIVGLPYRAKLLDFGLARLMEDARAARVSTEGFVGTLGYAAPEQLVNGRIGPTSDVWALGATAFFAATGRPAIAEGSDAMMMVLTMQGAIAAASELEPTLPATFDDWVRRACAAVPEHRFPDALTAARELRAISTPRRTMAA